MIANNMMSSVNFVIFDFDGVFTDNSVYVDQNGVESVRCCRSDGQGLARLRTIGVDMFILSTEVNPVVAARAKKLHLPLEQGVDDKQAGVLKACEKFEVDQSQTMFVGNDINDIPALQSVGFPVAVADAYLEILPHVVYQTQRKGGYGAVREVCDLIYRAKMASPNR